MFLLGVLRDLAIGCVVTWLVAWGIRIWQEPTGPGAVQFRFTMVVGQDRTLRIVEGYRGGLCAFTMVVGGRQVFPEEWEQAIAATRPWHDSIPSPPDLDVDGIRSHGLAAGWPLLALWAQEAWFMRVGNSMTEVSPSRAPFLTIQPPFTDRRIPFPRSPIWIGFIVDALIYACALRAMFMAFTWWRVRRRSKRGLCRRCGHPLDVATTCPECGMPAPANARTIASLDASSGAAPSA